MLSQTAEHALRALLFLARQEPETPVSADRIADALGAPRNYLGKTLHALTRAGFVEGVRGPAGGYRLTADPARLSVADLIAAVDDPGRRTVCLLGDRPCDDGEPCPAHRRWTALERATQALLQRTTLTDLIEPGVGADGAPATPYHPRIDRILR